jgi:predicted MFS family arabinose efflux permease
MGANVAGFAIGRGFGSFIGGILYRAGGYGLTGTIAGILMLISASLILRFVVEKHHHREVEQPIKQNVIDERLP